MKRFEATIRDGEQCYPLHLTALSLKKAKQELVSEGLKIVRIKECNKRSKK